MNEKKYAKALLLNDEIIDVSLLPIGEAKLVNTYELSPTFDEYDPFKQPQKKIYC